MILNMICFEYLILAFDNLVEWTGTGKTDKIKIREKVLAAVEKHRINLAKISDEKTLQYIADFKRYSTERVMKSLVGEFTQNEKWSVKGALMGECWYKDCCVIGEDICINRKRILRACRSCQMLIILINI